MFLFIVMAALIALAILAVICYSLRAKSEDHSPEKSRLKKWDERLVVIENYINIRIAIWLFVLMIIAMLAGIAAYGIYGSAKDALEYGSYIMPCIGGAIAAFAIYKKTLERLLFSASIICILIGMELFLASHGQHVLGFSISVISVCAFIALTLLFVFLRSPEDPRFGVIFCDAVVVALILCAVAYPALFIIHNSGCLREPVPVGQCRSLWLFY